MNPLLLLPLWPMAAAGASESGAACAHRVEWSGDPVAVAALRARWGTLTEGLEPGAACGPVRVTVQVEGHQWRLGILDADGRAAERVAADVAGAAAIIESWSRRDLDEPLLAERAGPNPEETPAAPAVSAAPPAESAPPGVAVSPTNPSGRVDLAVAGDGRISGDGALWTGVRAHLCVRTGPACLGAMAAWAVDTGVRGASDRRNTERTAFDLMVTAGRPFEFDRWTLAPGVAVGQTVVAVQRHEPGQLIEDETTSLHLRAHTLLARALPGNFTLGVELSFAWSPLVPVEYTDEEAVGGPLAGPPRWQTGLGLALGYVLP